MSNTNTEISDFEGADSSSPGSATPEYFVEPMEVIETGHFKLIDLKSMVKEEFYDEYRRGEKESTPSFKIDNLIMKLEVYPKGRKERDDGHVTIALKINNVLQEDTRLIVLTVNFGASESKSQSWRVSRLKDIVVTTRIPLEKIKKHPQVRFQLVLRNDAAFQPPSIQSVASLHCQNEKLFNICRETGDLMIQVDSEDFEFEPPPKKKRRLSHRYNTRSQSKEDITSIDDNETGHVLRMNSAILRAASPVFDRMLSTEMMEKQSKQITIHAKSVEAVEELMYFCCTNKLRQNSNLLQLIPLAHYYGMDRLFWMCAETICNKVEIDTFVETVDILNKFEIKQGFNQIVRFGKNNIEKLKKRDDFTNLSCGFRTVTLGIS